MEAGELYPDAHRHGPPLAGTRALVSRDLEEKDPSPPGAWSLGLHPWHLRAETLEVSLEGLSLALRRREGSGIVAVGECGLDRVCTVPWALQVRAFEAQLDLADEHSLPVVLHVVKAFPEILQAHRQVTTPWFVHGFRGGPELALDLWRHGIRLSFGPALLGSERLQTAFVALPLEAILLESDDTSSDMARLYAQAARLKGMDIPALIAQVEANLGACGISL